MRIGEGEDGVGGFEAVGCWGAEREAVRLYVRQRDLGQSREGRYWLKKDGGGGGAQRQTEKRCRQGGGGGSQP